MGGFVSEHIKPHGFGEIEIDDDPDEGSNGEFDPEVGGTGCGLADEAREGSAESPAKGEEDNPEGDSEPSVSMSRFGFLGQKAKSLFPREQA